MNKIIWTCWLNGEEHAPLLVRKCLESWKSKNPGWDFRCLDAVSITRYIDIVSHIALGQKRITPASLTEILRLLLLHEYGGLWVDATTFCNRPLDEWLPMAAGTGFFAFCQPGGDCPVASWLIAAQPGNELLTKWTRRVIDYWQTRTQADDPQWFQRQFGALCAGDRQAHQAWQNVPRIGAEAAEAIQRLGMFESFAAMKDRVDWTMPVYDLTDRAAGRIMRPDSLVGHLLELTDDEDDAPSRPAVADSEPLIAGQPLAQLKVATENVGDHIQILAAERLCARAGLTVNFRVDRDDEIAHPPPVAAGERPAIVMNGWFKTNPAEWPPHPAYRPIYLGFHMRLFQSPSLVSPEALRHYASHGPIGCRDRYTLSMLRGRGVDAFLSHCLTLSLPRRLSRPEQQTEVFVVSRDRGILKHVPESVGPHTFISHYADTKDFDKNKARAAELLNLYSNRARLIVTTLLHCALPAIALGIPVVVFYPSHDGPGHKSDRERFSSLAEMVRVFNFSEAAAVNWRGYTPDVSLLKLRMTDQFFGLAARWGRLASVRSKRRHGALEPADA